MISVKNEDSVARARYEIERAMLDASEWELWEDGGLAATLTPANLAFSVEWGKLIFAWWDEGHAQSWRVLAYEATGPEIRLQVTRGLARDVRRLTLRDPVRWGQTPQAPRDVVASRPERRAHFGAQLAEWVARDLPGVKLIRATTGTDRTHSVTGNYARLILRRGRETILLIGVSAAESQQEIDGVIATGLVWLATYNQRREARRQARRLWFSLPVDRSLTALERLTWIDVAPLNARIECFEMDEARGALTPLRPVTQTELLNAHPHDAVWPPRTIRGDFWRPRILALAPDLIEVRERPHRPGECFSIHGLEFAYVVGGARPGVKFGVAGARDEASLTEDGLPALGALVDEIARVRRADSPDRQHPFYRLRAEAWLESLLRRDIRALDARLDERFVYSQVPTWRGEERSVIDLLSVDHQGRLVVIEIKVNEDRQLPLQGLDYWMRVEQARLRGEFARRGLFPGVTLADQPPLLYLVAPRLRFHRSFAVVANCLSPRVEAWRIGINDNWRDGVRGHAIERVSTRRETDADCGK
ncbi:MAG: hypothetical protein SF339_12890 [Blastocatellia bacterium]|nr:hypothetical protein [Blastocatellia bacterium]